MALPHCTLSYFQPPASAPSIYYSVLEIIKSLVVVLMTFFMHCIDSASKYYLDNISRLSHKDCQGAWTVDIRIFSTQKPWLIIIIWTHLKPESDLTCGNTSSNPAAHQTKSTALPRVVHVDFLHRLVGSDPGHFSCWLSTLRVVKRSRSL